MMNIAEIKDMVRSASGITEFQRRVYLALLDVPKGSIITYGELALKVGCKSPRAIGNALHKNPFAPLVPCHRVIRANGEIGGYAFGQQEKLRLLTYKMIHVCTAGIPHDDGRESLQYLYLYHKISNDEYCRDKGYGP